MIGFDESDPLAAGWPALGPGNGPVGVGGDRPRRKTTQLTDRKAPAGCGLSWGVHPLVSGLGISGGGRKRAVVMRFECDGCGVAACDLPDGVDPEEVFVAVERGRVLCQGCVLAESHGSGTWSITAPD